MSRTRALPLSQPHYLRHPPPPPPPALSLCIICQDDCLDAVLDLLPAADLAAVELAGWPRASHLIVTNRLWRRAVHRLHPALLGLPTADGAPRPPVSSALWRRLAWELAAPADHLSLIADALGASSTDRPSESVANTLCPRAHPHPFGRGGGGAAGAGDGADPNGDLYWSSSGSASQADSCEWVAYRAVAPLCLVTHVTVRPFRAYFQPGLPVYAPAAVTLCGGRADLWAVAAGAAGAVEGGGAGGGAPPPPPSSFDPRDAPRAAAAAAAVGAPGGGGGGGHAAPSTSSAPPPSPWAWATDALPVARSGAPQCLALPRPALLAGGHAHLACTGATQAQAEDGRFYTCLAYVALHGRALRGLGVSWSEPPGGSGNSGHPASAVSMLHRAADTVRAAGGLAAISEGGRTAGREGRAAARRAAVHAAAAAAAGRAAAAAAAATAGDADAGAHPRPAAAAAAGLARVLNGDGLEAYLSSDGESGLGSDGEAGGGRFGGLGWELPHLALAPGGGGRFGGWAPQPAFPVRGQGGGEGGDGRGAGFVAALLGIMGRGGQAGAGPPPPPER